MRGRPPGRPVGRRHQDDIRRKIQASQLINRLSNHALGQTEMTPTQIKAAEILLKKTLPDLSQIEGPGENGEHELKATLIWGQPVE